MMKMQEDFALGVVVVAEYCIGAHLYVQNGIPVLRYQGPED